MDIPRILDLEALIGKKSFFLFGPRQVGKTFAIKKKLGKYKYYNLLDTEVFFRFSQSPKRLREEISDKDEIVIIDEVQKLPILLNEVQLLIDERGINFLLTGSSARKLRRKEVNLLGGRARTKFLHPFIFSELKESFDLIKALDTGLIPSIYFSDEAYADLEAYVGQYLKEEIAAEAYVRNIPAFSRFLSVAGLCDGKIINYTNIANDAQVSRSTVQEYFEILKDTLIASELSAWKQSVKRKPLSTSKIYLFDIGVARFLQNRRGLMSGSPDFGDAFESYIHHELRSFCDYNGINDLHYWRSTSGFEVDFILGNEIAIEVKGKKNITPRDLKGLKAIKEEQLLKKYLLISLDEVPRTIGDDINIIPWRMFLNNLWSRKYI